LRFSPYWFRHEVAKIVSAAQALLGRHKAL
jgi:hypothetical protein